MSKFITDIVDYCCSGHAMLNVSTFEKDRAIAEIVKAGAHPDLKREVYIWSVAHGWLNSASKNPNNSLAVDPKIQQIEKHIEPIANVEEDAIFVLKDFGVYLDHKTYPAFDLVISWLDFLKRILPGSSQTIIFVGPGLDIPTQLSQDITTVDFDLPSEDEILERVKFSYSDVELADGSKFQPTEDHIEDIVGACRGMTSQQIVDRVTLALRKHKDLNEHAVETITREKAAIIRSSGILNYIEPPEGGLSIVGGYDAIKRHVELDKPCFGHEAAEFGIKFPRGIMMVGVPGCGKTLISTAIASYFNLPLIALDVGSLMSKFVGESEEHLRTAIKLLESISPCVLQLDEIEKGFGGNGERDGGTSTRVFGGFIKWMNDRKSPVYIVATANQVQSLPPEFCRKGRIDEIFGLGLPQTEEREQIFSIHIGKVGRDPANFDLKELASATDGYTGADIEQIVSIGLKTAFMAKEDLSTDCLLKCVDEIIPLSKTEANRIKTIEEWCQKHAKPAHIDKRASRNTKRKVTV